MQLINDLKLLIQLTDTQKWIFILTIGAILGFIAGAVGIGGGIYLVPLIIMFGLGTEKEAAAAGAMFIWVNSLVGVIARAKIGYFDLQFILPLAIAVLIGGFVGFSFAGPIGALIGSMVGGRISSARRSGFQRSFAPPQQVFAIALIILTAKLAKADGQVSKEELIAVKNKLKIPEHEIDQVGKIFNKAKEDTLGYEPYAQQIAQIYRNNPVVLDEVINILFYIAEADGKVSDSEIAMIRNIAIIFGISQSQFEGIR